MQIQAQSKIVISLSKMTELFAKNDNFGAIFSILKHILGLSISNYLTKKIRGKFVCIRYVFFIIFNLNNLSHFCILCSNCYFIYTDFLYTDLICLWRWFGFALRLYPSGSPENHLRSLRGSRVSSGDSLHNRKLTLLRGSLTQFHQCPV